MRVELPPRLITLVGGLSLTGHLGAVRDKTTLCCGLGNGRTGIQQARRVGEELDFV